MTYKPQPADRAFSYMTSNYTWIERYFTQDGKRVIINRMSLNGRICNSHQHISTFPTKRAE